MEPGGKGSFQAVKLQRPARTTVCSHSHKGHAAIGSIESKHDDNDTQDEYLSGCGQLQSEGANERPDAMSLPWQLYCEALQSLFPLLAACYLPFFHSWSTEGGSLPICERNAVNFQI
jgi:hypothetical protein